METKEIFEANHILTVEIAKTLIGKKIAVTNPEYSANKADVRVCTVLGVETEFEAAKRNPQEKYGNQQAMWIAENNETTIARAKKRLKLIYEGENPYATCEDSTRCLPEGTFFGSDSDRPIYYIEITYKVQNKETGTVIESGLTFEDAKKTLDAFEAQDKEDGIYEPDFYEIEQE